jgi:peptidoglycan/xylan/chitin deacetylase (PgdA/CDA1 family)
MMRTLPIFCVLVVLLWVVWMNQASAQTVPLREKSDTFQEKCILLDAAISVGKRLYENRDKTPEALAEELTKELRERFAPKQETNAKAVAGQSGGHRQYYIYSGPKEVKAVALTYDDGPNERFTPRLIEVLKRKGVPATFFFVGEQVNLYPDVARQVAQNGFEIGNHTYDHRSLRKLAPAEAADQIDRTQKIIAETTGVRAGLLRPPYGECNADVVEMARQRGLGIIFWTIDTNDYQRQSTKADIVGKVMRDVSNGAIILMHDRNTKTIEATEEIIDGLSARGYKFCSVTDLLAPGK